MFGPPDYSVFRSISFVFYLQLISYCAFNVMRSQLIYNYFSWTNFIQRRRGKYFSITVPEKHSSTCFETKRGSGNQSFNIKPHSIFGYRSEVLIVYPPRVSFVELKNFSCIPWLDLSSFMWALVWVLVSWPKDSKREPSKSAKRFLITSFKRKAMRDCHW